MPSVPTSTLDAALPRTSGGFRMLRELGRGGMGVVYEAEELSSGRRVALKVLAAELVVSGEAFERFRREARIAAAISDSRCVFVYGAHEVDGAPAIAMELVGGETLEQRLSRKEPVPIATAVRWTLEMLEGLEAAHAAGIVHRDVKPSNCFTTDDGHVKIGDFGLSRSLERDVRLTQSGAFLGSPLYASPEQIRGREVDVRSDLYSCGATLYALLTGRPPYEGTNVGEVLARILSEPPPPPRSVRPEIPRALEKVVLRAMERDPEKRFKDHASFRAALQPFAHSTAVPAGLLRRCLAYMIDSAALSVVHPAALTLSQALNLSFAELDPTRPQMYKSQIYPALLTGVIALYFVVLEGVFGATLGKWLVGQRVVAQGTGQPSFPRALLRSFVYFLPGTLAVQATYWIAMPPAAVGIVAPAGALVSLLVLFSSARRRNGFRGLHDFASGMRVVQVQSPFTRFRSADPPPNAALKPAEDWPSQLASYRVDGLVGRTPTGVILQAHDTDLDRGVWIHAHRDPTRKLDDVRRSLTRATRLRWLDSIEHDGAVLEVFEAPGGASFAECARAQRGFEWPLVLRFLTSLCEELADADRDDGSSTATDRAQLWIDRSWMLRVLDERLDAPPSPRRTPTQLLTDVAQGSLPSRRGVTPALPPDLPAHAEPVARRIFGPDPPYSSVREAHRALVDLAGRPDTITRRMRGAQMTLACAFPAVCVLVLITIMWMSTRLLGGSLFAATYAHQLARDADTSATAQAHAPLTDDGRRARQIVIAAALESPISDAVLNSTQPREREIMVATHEAMPHPTAEERAWAKSVLADESARDPNPVGRVLRQAPGEPMTMAALVACCAGIGWTVIALVFAFAFHGGLSLTLFGVRVRNRRGALASRFRCVWRTAAAAVPLVVLYALPCVLIFAGHAMIAYVALAIGVGAHAAWIAHAILRPSRSLQDRLAGTQLVPR